MNDLKEISTYVTSSVFHLKNKDKWLQKSIESSSSAQLKAQFKITQPKITGNIIFVKL